MEKSFCSVLSLTLGDIIGYSLIDQLYLSESDGLRMSTDEIQQVLLDQAMQSYDSASNGNRTRGSMKKAFDL